MHIKNLSEINMEDEMFDWSFDPLTIGDEVSEEVLKTLLIYLKS